MISWIDQILKSTMQVKKLKMKLSLRGPQIRKWIGGIRNVIVPMSATVTMLFLYMYCARQMSFH